LQAEIAACHSRARTWAETDWRAMDAAYEQLEAVALSPVVTLNRAVAISMIEGPAAGLARLDALASDHALRGYHLLPAARADFLRQLGRMREAAEEYGRAMELAQNERERAFLARRRAECQAAT
jgi:predicted RNA polymerase sigma factor